MKLILANESGVTSGKLSGDGFSIPMKNILPPTLFNIIPNGEYRLQSLGGGSYFATTSMNDIVAVLDLTGKSSEITAFLNTFKPTSKLSAELLAQVAAAHSAEPTLIISY